MSIPGGQSNQRKAFLGLVVSLPAIAIAALVWRYTVNIPFFDEWALVHDFRRIDAGTLDAGDLWAQHNEHRVFLPRLLLIAVAYLTNWNLRTQIMLNLMVPLAMLAVLVWNLKRTIASSTSLIVLAGAASLLVFSPAQWENQLWSWQLIFFMTAFAVVITLGFLSSNSEQPSWRILVKGLAGGVFASLCSAAGLLVWPVGALVIVLRPKLRKLLGIWLLASIVVIGFYVFRYVKPPWHPPVLTVLETPVDLAKYLLAYLGSPISNRIRLAYLAAIAGLSGFGLAAFSAWRAGLPQLERATIWIGLGIFALASDVTTAVARLGFGVEQALTSRYKIFSGLFWIATFALVAQWIERREFATRQPALAVAGLTSVALLVPFGLMYRDSLEMFEQRQARLLKGVECFESEPSNEDPCLLSVYPTTKVVWGLSKDLESRGWGGFK